MLLLSNFVAFTAAFLSMPVVFASPIDFRRDIPLRDIDIDANTLEARNGYHFYQAVKDTMRERPDAMMKPMVDHVVNTYHRNNIHENTRSKELWGNVRKAIYTNRVVQSTTLDQMRMKNRLHDLQDPYKQAVHDGIHTHQHPREVAESGWYRKFS